MSTSRIWIAAVAFSLAAGVALLPVGIAHADCTGAGDFGAGAGCPPPGSSSGSGNTESWPPASVDWPPQLNSDSGSGSAGHGDGGVKPTPIVMPDGQKASAGHTVVRLGFDQHLDTAHADRSGWIGAHRCDAEH